MVKKRILIVEDEKDIVDLIKYNLGKAGFNCSVSKTGEECLDTIEKKAVDLVLLDIMLPEIDGLEVCRRIKRDERFSRMPVIMLTAKGEEMDKVVGFELGADDYVTKPFSPRELALRIKAVLKRYSTQETEEDILKSEKLVVDIPRHSVKVGGKEVKLTPMEFKLLCILMKRAGRVQSRERLLNDVWDMASDVTTRTIDTHIKRLRGKIGKPGSCIETVRGIGYKFREET
jgi:DNA-binding response OmpR family regulator